MPESPSPQHTRQPPEAPTPVWQGWLRRFRQWRGAVYWREAVLCTPAMVILLVVGLPIHLEKTVIMTAAAFAAGRSASRTQAGWRWGEMWLTVMGITVATFAGSLAGLHPPLLLALLAVLAGVCAGLACYNNHWWWVTLRIVIAFLVAGHYPNAMEAAGMRSVLVLAGSGLQTVCVMLLGYFFPVNVEPLPLRNPWARKELLRFGLGTAIATVLSLYLAQRAGLQNDYWAPMTALLVMRPTPKDTWARSLQRLAGTLAGCLLATVLIYAFHTSVPALAACLILSAALSFAMQKAHYALYSSMISATIVFLLAIAHDNPIATTEHRLIDTALGGAVAIVVGWLIRWQSYVRAGKAHKSHS